MEAWQRGLRHQFGRLQPFRAKNVGKDPVFSEFAVTNPESGRTYRIAIRGANPGDNYCSCPDFAVNTLGTCKHVEFMLGKLERKPGAKAALAKGFHPVYSEIYLRHGAKREIAFRAGKECPPSLLARMRRHFDGTGILRLQAYRRFDRLLETVKSNGHEVRCYADAIDYAAQVRDQERLRALVDAHFPKIGSLDKLLKIGLYPYQEEGARFAARAGRSLIADEMGLGKTFQAIGAAEILARTVGIERVLVVCPTSLKHQWKEEIERATDRSATIVQGSLAVRAERYREPGFFKIANYEVVHRDLKSILAWKPDLVILDEAQRIKNWKTRAARTVKQIPSEYAIVLTGTPLENRLEELHSIVEFVDRFHLGPMFRFLAEHQILDEAGKVTGYRNLDRINQTLKPILLRRNKQEVLKQLPGRVVKNFFVPMTSEQTRHHEENAEIVGRIVQRWRRFGFLSEKDQRFLMIALQRMRMSCNSSYLLDPTSDHGTKADDLMALLSDLFERSGKVIVFSQWLRTHEILVRRLRVRKWGYVLFHGGVPGPKRKDLIQRFREDPDCRIFLSTDAGGVGLNLQVATTVVSMDQPWNPAVLEQRIGRAHRLGQHRTVQVFNYISEGTIEHGMLDLLKFKRSLFAGVLDGDRSEVLLGASRLKRFMESVERLTTETSQDPSAVTGIPETNGQDQARPKGPEAVRTPWKSQTAAQTDALAGLVEGGLRFLDALGKKLNNGHARTPVAKTRSLRLESLVERDPKTGQPFLKLPMPSEPILRKVSDLLGQLAKAFG